MKTERDTIAHQTVETLTYQHNGIPYIPSYEHKDIFVAPGGKNISGAYLRHAGAIPTPMFLWPRNLPT